MTSNIREIADKLAGCALQQLKGNCRLNSTACNECHLYDSHCTEDMRKQAKERAEAAMECIQSHLSFEKSKPCADCDYSSFCTG